MRSLLLSTLFACAHQAPIAAPTPEPDPYLASLDDAAFPLPAEVVPDLLTLTLGTPGLVWDDAGRLLVTTWSRSSFYPADPYRPGYTFPLYGETWFSTGTEVADACAGLGERAPLRVEQLLGLPPGGGRDVFLQVWIDPDDLFRPCFEPDVQQPSCPITSPVQVSTDGVSSWTCSDLTPGSHTAWLCATWVARYGVSDPGRRYPWTALGYTYDWSPERPTHRGVSEFVAPKGTSVTLHAIVPNETFCGAR